MTLRRIEPLGLGDILGSLMSSVIGAQAQSARATVAFIEDVGFEKSAAGDKLRTVSVLYEKLDENNQPATFAVEMPLLAMVNIPSLAVKNASFALAYDVLTTEPGEASAKQGAKMLGFVRKKNQAAATASQSTSIDIDIVIEQQEVPAGIARLFDLAELGIAEKPVNG
ncbi:MAG: DUF2589 domain-containing protein [Pseudomonadota bacterium]